MSPMWLGTLVVERFRAGEPHLPLAVSFALPGAQEFMSFTVLSFFVLGLLLVTRAEPGRT